MLCDCCNHIISGAEYAGDFIKRWHGCIAWRNLSVAEKFTWKNYITVLQKDNLITGAYVTVARTVIGTVLALAANAILAFVVSRKDFCLREAFPCSGSLQCM